jgi:hypothetical protein
MAGIRAVISTLMNDGREGHGAGRSDMALSEQRYHERIVADGGEQSVLCAQESWRDPQRLRDGSRHRRRPAAREYRRHFSIGSIQNYGSP